MIGVEDGNLLRIVNFTCTRSLFSGDLTYVLTLEEEGGGLVFDAVISTATANALLGEESNPPQPADEAAPPLPAQHTNNDEEEQG